MSTERPIKEDEVVMKYENLLADRATGHPAMTDEYTIDTMADFLLLISMKIAVMQAEIDELRLRLDGNS
jgi:hypothetical protein